MENITRTRAIGGCPVCHARRPARQPACERVPPRRRASARHRSGGRAHARWRLRAWRARSLAWRSGRAARCGCGALRCACRGFGQRSDLVDAAPPRPLRARSGRGGAVCRPCRLCGGRRRGFCAGRRRGGAATWRACRRRLRACDAVLEGEPPTAAGGGGDGHAVLRAASAQAWTWRGGGHGVPNPMARDGIAFASGARTAAIGMAGRAHPLPGRQAGHLDLGGGRWRDAASSPSG